MKREALRALKKAANFSSINRIVKLLCGEKLDYGLYRDVYVFKHDDRYVVKVERDMSEAKFANVTEWRNYIDNQHWAYIADWLAPCDGIGETGQWMIQRRVSREGKRRKDYPKYIPVVFTDLKLTNFGWIGDKFVCCDYSFFVMACTDKNKMKYAKWWGKMTD